MRKRRQPWGVEGRKSDTSDDTLVSHGGPGNACHLRLTSNCLISFHCEEEFCRTLKLPSFLSCGITAIYLHRKTSVGIITPTSDINLKISQRKNDQGFGEPVGSGKQRKPGVSHHPPPPQLPPVCPDPSHAGPTAVSPLRMYKTGTEKMIRTAS